VCQFIPHSPVLERAVCVIPHGGMGTTVKALDRGIPVCVVPYPRSGRSRPASRGGPLRNAPARQEAQRDAAARKGPPSHDHDRRRAPGVGRFRGHRRCSPRSDVDRTVDAWRPGAATRRVAKRPAVGLVTPFTVRSQPRAMPKLVHTAFWCRAYERRSSAGNVFIKDP